MRRRWALQSQDRTTTAPSSPIEVESQPASPPRSITEDFEAHLAALASEPAPPCSDFIEDPAPIQPSIAQVFQRQRLLQAYPKNPPNAKHSHGDLPTVADLIVGPTTARATPRRNTFYPPVPQADRALHIAPPPKRYRPEPALQFGGLPVPPPPSLPRSLAGSTATQIIPHSSLKSPPATPRPPPASQTPLAPPRPRTVKFRTVRSSLASRMNICGTLWLQLVYKLGKASHLLQSVEAAKQASDHIMAVIRNNTPGTLERYLRIASLFMDFLGSSAISFLDVSLHRLLDFLALARASHSQDLEIHRISAASSIKALRWFVRQTQWSCLSNALESPIIRAYSLKGTAKDRREALPIPWALIAAWEQRICDPNAPVTTVVVLGAALLAIHASLRFGDLQRIDFSSLSLSTSALHGTCWATKTTAQGQPFAVTLAGITGRCKATCWTLHWLSALHRIVASSSEDPPDFLWFSTALDHSSVEELAPASYCTALLSLRYLATLPWKASGNGLLPSEAKQLTLHSMKSTLLAAAAQLRVYKELRLAQGHHRDSARLYSRNDTFDSLDLQHRLAQAFSTGWRPNRSVARGGQAPIPEPPFHLPAGDPLQSITAGMCACSRVFGNVLHACCIS
ncbi:unnamed protein product [Symbiodinium sp. CCMP2592]|nr:unnamed protein product [Symbiodinium sp. CCMP2592]